MELEVTPAFPTLIGRFRIPDADAMNRDLHALILAEEAKYASLGRSNIGGWHSRPDFLSRRGSRSVRADDVAHLGFAPNDRCQRGSECVPGYAVGFRVGDPLPRGGVPCAPLSSGQRMVRRVLCGSRNRQPGSAAQRCSGVPRPACGRGGRDCAGRSIRRAFSGSTASRTARGIPELAVSLGSPLHGPNTPHRNLVQRRAGSVASQRIRMVRMRIACNRGTVHVHSHPVR